MHQILLHLYQNQHLEIPKRLLLKLSFLFLLKEVFFFEEEEEAGGETLGAEEASLIGGRKTSGVKSVWGIGR
jgi:hypothetical protein